MSDKRSNLGTAGLIVAGGALVGAACYAAYEMFKESSFFRAEQPQQHCTRENRGNCPVCLRGFSEDTLPPLPACEHRFHKTCLQANHILHMNEAEYRCPVCQVAVDNDFINEFLL